MKPAVNIFWFRRDLRLADNAGLYHALRNDRPVVPIFIFDRNILDELEKDPGERYKKDRRIDFIYHALEKMQAGLIKSGSSLDVRYGFPGDVYKQLMDDYRIPHRKSIYQS